MTKQTETSAKRPADKSATTLPAPVTLAAEQLESVAAGVSAALFPGRPGPVNGIVQAEK